MRSHPCPSRLKLVLHPLFLLLSTLSLLLTHFSHGNDALLGDPVCEVANLDGPGPNDLGLREAKGESSDFAICAGDSGME